MPERTPRFSAQQIGTAPFRFSSGIPIPTMMDASTDPYFKTRVPKEAQVEGVQFWPQEKGTYPGLVLLHESWGLTAQIKNLAHRLACEGLAVIAPNLYARQGGMVTANAEVAETLAGRIKEDDLLQDINSCCEFLNTRDVVARNVHGVIGFGFGGSLALRFACQRKRLRGAIAFYAKVTTPLSVMKTLSCPILYHRAGTDSSVTDEEIDRLIQGGRESGKKVDIIGYEGAPAGFCHEGRPEYHSTAATAAWESSLAFFKARFQAGS